MADTVLLCSADRKISVPKSITSISSTITNMIEKCSGTGEITIGPVVQDDESLYEISGETLQIMIDYMTDYNKNVASLPEEARKELVSRVYEKLFEQEWVAQYVRPGVTNVPGRETLYKIIMAAHYLNIDSLEKMCCRQLADMIQGKSRSEIRKMFGVDNLIVEEDQIIGKDELNDDQIVEEDDLSEEPTNEVVEY